MADLLIRVLINAAALIVAAAVVPNLNLSLGNNLESWIRVGFVAFLLGLLNAYLRPIVAALALPITLLTLGLVGIAINAAMLLVLSVLSDALNLPFSVNGFPDRALDGNTILAAVLGAIVIGLVAAVVGFVFSGRRVLRLRI
jgi:putative membrane protein